ncbi:N-acetyltransferase [Kocuria varians]|uniref:N-acetyltransferase n=1 Tax=Kocuria varians TaxID=1272 RepID=A0A4Y4D6L1_KOCVA|nr:GNAT family N-acetyltransferase [Kocuria varians]GEC99243.1 N-acetyltransferase [Kocuria varians]
MKWNTSEQSTDDYEIVRATAEDVGAASEVLAQAFSEDPHVIGMLPRGDVSRALLRLWRRILKETLSAGGHAYLAKRPGHPEILGVALWEAPGYKVSLRQMAPGLASYLGVFKHRLPDAAVSEYLAHEAHPHGPHWYLKALATAPEVRGEGVGTRLLAERLPVIDGEHAEAYLEASTESLVPYYSRFGFVSRGPVPCRGTVPAVGMLRPAAA